MHLLTQLCSKCLAHFCYGPDILQDAKGVRVSKAEMVPALMELTVHWWEITTNQ